MQSRQDRGKIFTLVELIIVVIILGILAAVAIPQFVSSADDAKITTLQADLAVLRNAISLYYHQHDSKFPGAIKTDGSGNVTVGGDNPTAFTSQLTQYSAAIGNVSVSIDRTNYPFGPYITGGVPENPIDNSAVVEVLDEAAPLDAADVGTGNGNGAGWIFSKLTGEIRSCTVAGDLTY